MDEDADLVRIVAGELVSRSGKAALAQLYDFAEISAGIGDQTSAETWLDIARAAEALLAAGDRTP